MTNTDSTQGPSANLEQATRWLSARALGPDVFNFALRERNGDIVGTEIVGILGSFHVPKCGYLIRTGLRLIFTLCCWR